jgi:aryl-alcohol dehydrogenase-like predicted oxidoreductase
VNAYEIDMELQFVGNSDIKITPIIMGTWQAGKSGWSGIDDTEITKAIRGAFDGGITTFDTAEEYGWGYSEQVLGSALSNVRDQVIFATKVHPRNLKYDQVISSCHRSLKNLKTDYLDLYQIHWPSGSWGTKKIPIEETMEANRQPSITIFPFLAPCGKGGYAILH